MVLLTAIETPIDGIRHKQDNTCACIGESEIGKGCIYITESSVVWLNENSQGFTLCYPSISLHAVSRDVSAYPKHCLYVMFDGKLSDESSNEEEDEENGDAAVERDPEPDFTEVRFVPEDSTALDTMYSALCDCQLLHPDVNDSPSEDDENGEYEAVGPSGDNEVAGVDNDDQDVHEDLPQVGIVYNGDGVAMDTDEVVDQGQFEDVDE